MLAIPKLLIADDDVDLRNSLATALERRGYLVSLAGDGRQGLDLVRTAPIDLALVDYQMPHFTGLELLRELRDVRPEVPCILMSGALDEIVCEEARRMRAYSILSKPIRLREIDLTIRRALAEVYGWDGSSG